MAGMEGLGRDFNVVPIASGVAISMRDCSAVTFICTGQTTFTLTVSGTFGGSYVSPGNIISRVYWSTATNGTAAWNKLVLAAAADNVVPGTTAGLTTANMTAIWVSGSMLADPKCYIKCTGALTMAIVHDLTVKRGPANLAKLSA